MTGKELIQYILDNNLEDKPVFKNGNLIGYISAEETAKKFDVGTATVKVWYQLGAIDGFKIGEQLFIAANAKPKIKKEDQFDMTLDLLSLYIKTHQ